MCLIINRVKTAGEVQPVIPKHDIFKARREREKINSDLIDAIKTQKNRLENEERAMDEVKWMQIGESEVIALSFFVN